MSDEHDLVEAAQAGSVVAFTELVHHYRERLLRFLLTRCSSYADAEDALQDTFINAFRYLHSYDARWRFSTWLYRIAIRNATSQSGRDFVELDDIGDDTADPLRACIEVSERENLWLVARRVLTDEVYAAMWLRYVEDMSINDVAAVLERSTSWTKVNLLRARQALDAGMQKRASADGSKAYG
jgi:RNA polymerase sigma-70 factor (ECF subfamily)